MSACPSWVPAPRLSLVPPPAKERYLPVHFATAGAAHEELWELLRYHARDSAWRTRLRVERSSGGFAIVATEDDPEERAAIVAALEACDGNQTKAARVFGVSRNTFIARLDQYEIVRPRSRRAARRSYGW